MEIATKQDYTLLLNEVKELKTLVLQKAHPQPEEDKPIGIKDASLLTLDYLMGSIKQMFLMVLKLLPYHLILVSLKLLLILGENQFNEFIGTTLDRPSFSTGYFYESQYYLRVSTTTDGVLFDGGRIIYGKNIALNDYTGVSNESFSYSLLFADNIISGEMTFTVFNDTGFEVSKTISLITE